jgi:hypothetical protein
MIFCFAYLKPTILRLRLWKKLRTMEKAGNTSLSRVYILAQKRFKLGTIGVSKSGTFVLHVVSTS